MAKQTKPREKSPSEHPQPHAETRPGEAQAPSDPSPYKATRHLLENGQRLAPGATLNLTEARAAALGDLVTKI